MSDSLSIYKDDEGVFRFKGSLTYNQGGYSSVVVDGETYYKHYVKEVTSNVEDLNSSVQTYDLDVLGITVKVESWQDGWLMREVHEYKYSENSYISEIIALFKMGLLDDRIEAFYTTQHPPRYYAINGSTWNQILSTNKVPIIYSGYGFNNYLVYEVSVETFFNLDIKQIPKPILDMFSKNNISLKSKNKAEQAIRFYKQKINYHETSK